MIALNFPCLLLCAQYEQLYNLAFLWECGVEIKIVG